MSPGGMGSYASTRSCLVDEYFIEQNKGQPARLPVRFSEGWKHWLGSVLVQQIGVAQTSIKCPSNTRPPEEYGLS